MRFILFALILFLIGERTVAFSLPSNCRRSPDSRICNSDSILSNNVCDEFDRISTILSSYMLNDTHRASLFADVVFADLNGSDTLENHMREYAEGVFNNWDLNNYQNHSILIIASLNNSALYVYSPEVSGINDELFRLDLTGNKAGQLGDTLVIVSELITLALTGDIGHPKNTTNPQNGTEVVTGDRAPADTGILYVVLGIVGVLFVGIVVCIVYLMIHNNAFRHWFFRKSGFVIIDKESFSGSSSDEGEGDEDSYSTSSSHSTLSDDAFLNGPIVLGTYVVPISGYVPSIDSSDSNSGGWMNVDLEVT
jgi:hypothetical protein